MSPRSLLLVAVLSLAAGKVVADQSVFSSPLTAAGRPALSRICARISQETVVEGAFTQTKHLKRLSKDFVSRGRFIFAVDKGILWEVVTPFPSTTIITRARLVQRTPQGGTSVLDGSANPVFRRFADTLQAVFSGNLKAIEEEFDLFFVDRGESTWRLGLIPKDNAMRAVVASMEIAGDSSLREVLVTEAGADTVRYSFSDVRTPGALGADEEKLFF
jgi:Outer membrane lipoprotein carrier protein LolA